MKEHNEYDDIPVEFCSKCLSLAILALDDSGNVSYCKDCGSTHIAEENIFTWEKLYKMRYGMSLEERIKEKRFNSK